MAPDVVFGTSVGAVNGGWVASGGYDQYDRLAKIWGGLAREDIFPTRPLLGLLGFLGRRPNLVPAVGLRNVLKRHLGFERLEDAPIPLRVVVTDLLSGMDRCLATGDAVDAITASASIPAVFPPVRIDGVDYVDGGVVNNTPISHAIAQGADIVWVVSTGYACCVAPDFALKEPPKSALGMALHALSLTVNQRLAVDVERYEGAVDLRVVPPVCPIPISPADFSHSAELIDQAYVTTREWLTEGKPSSGQARLLEPHTH